MACGWHAGMMAERTGIATFGNPPLFSGAYDLLSDFVDHLFHLSSATSLSSPPFSMFNGSKPSATEATSRIAPPRKPPPIAALRKLPPRMPPRKPGPMATPRKPPPRPDTIRLPSAAMCRVAEKHLVGVKAAHPAQPGAEADDMRAE
jgi:hypothetical protein